MNAEIITIGTESLLFPKGNVSADYINTKLAELGIQVLYRTRVGDSVEKIVQVIRIATERVDLVITVGGLGVAENDLTREALSKAVARDLRINKKILDKITKKFESRRIKIPEGVERMAMLPGEGEYLENKAGIIPGIFVKLKSCTIVSLPGTTREVESIVDFSLVPKIKQFMKNVVSRRKIYHLIGVTELEVESQVKEFSGRENFPFMIHSSGGVIDMNILIEGADPSKIEKTISEIDEEVKKRFGRDIFGEDGDTLESVVGSILMEKNLTLAVAESCTGGMLAQRITDIPGSSQYFKGGIVCYTNEAKEKLLGISKKEIEDFGAISEEMAKTMALQVKRKIDSDYSISLTGIAGPAGGSVDKPVGLVFIGISSGTDVEVEKLTLSGDREHIRRTAVQRSLDLLRRKLIFP
jgi:nicotinamide-nucleotide amidase